MENKIALLSLLTFYFLYVETQERGISVVRKTFSISAIFSCTYDLFCLIPDFPSGPKQEVA